MRSSSTGKFTASLGVLIVAGCATSAPELPRYAIAAPDSTSAPAMRATVRVSSSVWAGLSGAEQLALRERYEIVTVAPDRYGMVIDAQGQDQSTAGTNGGAAIGAAAGSAAYIDHAFRGNNNYSATSQLGIALVGAALGSTLDTKASAQFQFRYTVKQGDGEVNYFDEIKGTPFRQSVGVCVLVPEVTLVTMQLCNQTPATFREKYLSVASAPAK